MDNISAIVEYDYTAKEDDELDLRKGAIIHHITQMPGGWWRGTLKSTGIEGMFPDNFVRVLDNNGSGSSGGEDAAVQIRHKSSTKNRRCKVIYSYTQVNDDELSLAVGDVIEFLGEVEEGWWRGRLKNKVGVFPSNFVEQIEPSPILASKRPQSTQLKTVLENNSSTARTTTINNASSSTTTAAAAATTTTTKKSNRLSYHNSKEDLLLGGLTSSATTTTSSAAINVAMRAASGGGGGGGDETAPILPPKPQRDYCRVEFPYAPQNDDELELKIGDVITIISMELPDKGWWRGELRGKVGVFPDNFVKLLPPSDDAAATIDATAASGAANANANASVPNLERGGSFEYFGARMASFINTIFAPLNDATLQQPQRTTKPTNTVANATANAVATAANTATQLTTNSSANNNSNASIKVFIKKSGSTSSTQSSNRKDSFGSRDSLNDILSETGLPTGNVAAQRKSLENKNFDLTNAADANTRLALKKQQQQKETITTTTATATAATTNNSMATSELRKSLDSLDEKAKSPPPPVLTKKPTVPSKKSTSVTSVAGNLLSGFKQKVKSVENKLTTAASHDYADGIGSSKLSPSVLPDEASAGGVVMRRAATIAVEDMEFDNVERGSMLADMRAGRVKAPKRRPPSAAINVLGESNNNSVYVNGSGMMTGSASELSEDGNLSGGGGGGKSDDNSTGEEQLAKPKPREWEKKKAPWMDELKASQVRKKTSPNVEPRGASVAERTSKLFADDFKPQPQNNIATSSSVIASAAATSSISSTSSSSTTTAAAATAVATTTATTKVQSNSVTSSSLMQQSMNVESSSYKTTAITSSSSSNSTSNSELMSKSMSSAKIVTAPTTGDDEARLLRPNSLALRNRSISPLVKTVVTTEAASTTTATMLSSQAAAHTATNTSHTNSNSNSNANATTASSKTTPLLNNHHHQPHQHGESKIPATMAMDATRVLELERRIEKLESVVHSQQRTIDDLVRTLREETDRVKVLRGELDKYAQCVTQV